MSMIKNPTTPAPVNRISRNCEDTNCRGTATGIRLSDASCKDLEKETRDLLTRFYRSYVGLNPGVKKHSAEPTLNRVVQDLVSKHGIAYSAMVRKLLAQTGGVQKVDTVLHSTFEDGVINWGRVASVLALGAMVCQQLAEDNAHGRPEECVDAVVSHITLYFLTHQRQWFINNNGWQGFVQFFHVEDPESVIRNTLFAVVGFSGILCLIKMLR